MISRRPKTALGGEVRLQFTRVVSISGLSIISFAAQIDFSFSQTARKFDPAESADIYKIIKPEIRRAVSKHYGANTGRDELAPWIEIETCADGSFFLPTRRVATDRLVDIAWKISVAERSLNREHYPENLWREPLSLYEQDALVRYKDGNNINQIPRIDKVVKQINMNISSHKLKKKKVSVARECGDGPREILVTTNPPGGTVYLIPKMLWLYCKQYRRYPTDPDDCEHWFSVKDNVTTSLGGVYLYKINNRKGADLEEKDADSSNGRVNFP